jgi:hypothetical protein
LIKFQELQLEMRIIKKNGTLTEERNYYSCRKKPVPLNGFISRGSDAETIPRTKNVRTINPSCRLAAIENITIVWFSLLYSNTAETSFYGMLKQLKIS